MVAAGMLFPLMMQDARIIGDAMDYDDIYEGYHDEEEEYPRDCE